MLTADSFKNINKEPCEILKQKEKPVKPEAETKKPIKNTEVWLERKSVKKVIEVLKSNSHGFISTKTILFKSGLGNSTVRAILNELKSMDRLIKRIRKSGKATENYYMLKLKLRD
jgi:ribosomal protein S25